VDGIQSITGFFTRGIMPCVKFLMGLTHLLKSIHVILRSCYHEIHFFAMFIASRCLQSLILAQLGPPIEAEREFPLQVYHFDSVENYEEFKNTWLFTNFNESLLNQAIIGMINALPCLWTTNYLYFFSSYVYRFRQNLPIIISAYLIKTSVTL